MEIYHTVRVVHLPSEGREKQIGVSGCLSCSWMSSSTAAWGMDTSRTEFSVLGRVSSREPSGLRTYCLLTEMVLPWVSTSTYRRATSSPFRRPLANSR